MNSRDIVCVGAALLAGTFCGIVDVLTTEVTSTIVVLLFCGFVTGVTQPVRFWLSALITGVWVPLMHEIAPLVGIPSAESNHIGGTIGMLGVGALSAILAMLGAGAGAASWMWFQSNLESICSPLAWRKSSAKSDLPNSSSGSRKA